MIGTRKPEYRVPSPQDIWKLTQRGTGVSALMLLNAEVPDLIAIDCDHL
jgi:hypothetical protein